MEIFGIHKFGGNGIGRVSHAQRLSGFGIAAVGVASLYHEVTYDAMEQGAVVIPLFGKFEEIGCMFWGVVIQAYSYVA